MLQPTFLPIVLVLASGRGARFAASGGAVYKLRAPLGAKTVLEHTLDAVRASVIKALEQKNVVEVIQGLGATPEPRMSRQDFVDHHAKERARFAPLIKEIGLKVD